MSFSLTGHSFFKLGRFSSYLYKKLPVKNFPASAKKIRQYTMNLSNPNSPTSSCAVGSGSSGPTSSPFANFSSLAFFLSSHSLWHLACSSQGLCDVGSLNVRTSALKNPLKICGCPDTEHGEQNCRFNFMSTLSRVGELA